MTLLSFTSLCKQCQWYDVFELSRVTSLTEHTGFWRRTVCTRAGSLRLRVGSIRASCASKSVGYSTECTFATDFCRTIHIVACTDILQLYFASNIILIFTLALVKISAALWVAGILVSRSVRQIKGVNKGVFCALLAASALWTVASFFALLLPSVLEDRCMGTV